MKNHTSLFPPGRNEATEIVLDGHDFFDRFERLTSDRSVFDSQGPAHGEIDLRLVQKIEAVLVPLLGKWEQSSTWFHQLDHYGDGVRSLVFRRPAFPAECLTQLQALLVDEHEPFAILCIATESLGATKEESPTEREDDYLAIFSGKILVTKALADVLPTGT